jgi:class 3 adenylate cyclase
MISVKPLPPQKLKGRSEPVEVFQVLDIKEGVNNTG